MPATVPGRVALPVLTALLTGTLTLAIAAPAHAADWTTVLSVHKAHTQLCKEPVADGWRVRIRLDDRSSDHAHNAGMSRGGATVSVRAAAGEVSKVKTLVVPRGSELVVGMGEPTGEGLGGDQDLGRVGRC
jgi:hypothetical protein